MLMRIMMLAAALWLAPVQAAIDVYEFEDPAQEQAFRELVRELRCPKCQNQDISDSNAELAKDLRDKTYDMLVAGSSKQEVIEYMVARYGNFILYKPPLMASTLILWVGPVLVILIGLAVVLVRTRKRSGAGSGEELSDEERARLARLLNKDKEN